MTATTPQPTQMSYPTEPIVNQGELPDLFALPSGARLTRPEQWPAQASAWRERVIGLMFGGMPPQPSRIEFETICHNVVRRLPSKPRFYSYRVHCIGGAKPHSFLVRILFPNRPGAFPAIVNGDACWWYVSDAVAEQVIGAGCALVLFDRTEMAEDLGYEGVPDKLKRAGGLYDVYPGQTFGAVAAWAWGYHRCIDLLHQLPFIDSRHIAVTGHSRGGKTALVAGATDGRIALVNDNASCAAGSAVSRYVGAAGETLGIVNVFPSWFGPEIRSYVGREHELPFDQHCLLAAIAPRPLLITYALDDRWSNPEGMVQSAWAAGEAYRFLGAGDRLAFHLRPGGHQHSLDDWRVLLDFIGWQWQQKTPAASYNRHPYSHLKRAFSWAAPETSEAVAG